MDATERKMFRVAETIQGQLRLLQRNRCQDAIRRIAGMVESFDNLRRANDLLAVCLSRGWNAAASQITDRVGRGLTDLPYYVSEIERMIDSSKLLKLPTLRDIRADLVQLEEEFEQFEYVEDGEELVVTTEAIELEDHYLGEFEIRLHIGKLAEMKRHSSIYRIVALDPHPAGCNESVTHPHVSDEHLCEGDASAAIEAALTNGRTCDFFQLVNAVLTTYNPHSPYVSLDHWEGIPCHDCGYTMSEGDAHWCESCQQDYCSECISYCHRCDESSCRGCLEECSVCGESMCSSCMTKCPECGKRLCKSCVEDQQCPCFEEDPEPEENEDEREPDEITSIPSDPDPAGNSPGQVRTEAA
ncbi:MAG: hypothetical protein NTV86_04900 [Planctomycetota bacterium]|nr:hypothetical protein [Planctomycetota bacterium]